jgi:hypothetical protein
MYKDTNLHLISKNKFKTLKDDLTATLRKNSGLRVEYSGKDKTILKGKYYLCNENDELIEHFDITICVGKGYPYFFPILIENSMKIERHIDNHINENGIACVEIDKFTKVIAKYGISIFDFIEYYVKKYFSWQLVKKQEGTSNLTEWAHYAEGDIQMYMSIIGSNDQNVIYDFLSNYLLNKNIGRNDKCICGSNKKLKQCHEDLVLLLKDIGYKQIEKDINLFKIKDAN